jgi:hypothetical protein
MIALTKSAPRRSRPVVDLLECRRLLSANWSTADTVYTYGGWVSGMASDAAGNVYVSANGPLPGSPPDTENDLIQQKSPGSNSWTTIYNNPNTASVTTGSDLATDASGNLFFGGETNGFSGGQYIRNWLIQEHRPGQDGFSTIDSISDHVPGDYGLCKALTTDAAGDIFAVGEVRLTTTTVSKGKATITTTTSGIIRELVPGPSGYTATTLYQAPYATAQFKRVIAIDSGPAAGIYVVGADALNGYWNVLKSSNGGRSWSQVDHFDFDPPTTNGSNTPNAIVADSSGNLYVGGSATKATITSYTTKTVHGKPTQVPVYTNVSHWIVRKSTNGGASWTTDDDFQLSSVKFAGVAALGVDRAGSVYAAGSSTDSSNAEHAIIRTNEGGSWAISDNYTGASQDGHPYAGSIPRYQAFTTDSDGNLYAAGREGSAADQNFFVRSAPDPTAMSAPATVMSSSSPSSSSLFSSTWITGDSGLMKTARAAAMAPDGRIDGGADRLVDDLIP